ncbi:centrosomal protein of 112 kDa-like isoform X4 [Biomphalaria glabrata]|nr:centrosomal protein of 112 kDa-like isoform X4 [Biomphalaria glabrata]
MESDSVLESQLDREFDKYLTDMKPHVLKLPQKTERQKCAVWIKKLCEPVRGGVSARKTRNLYAQLMLQMLKKGSWDSPFDQKPESGALKPLPSYLIEKLPDWVEGELAETVGSSIFAKTLGIPAATSTRVSNSAEFLERPHTSMGHTLEKDPSLSLSPIRHTEGTQPRYSADDLSIELQRSPKISHRHQKGHHHSPSGDREKRLLPDVRVKESRENDKIKEVTISESDWSKPYSSTTSSTYSLLKGTTFYDDPSFLKPADREIAMRAKVIEAKFHEEKLKLQQRHDTAVQKILDRKNLEIEDMKNLYKAKTKDLEETIDKLERKVQNLIKETEFIKQSKDKQIAELKKIADDSNETRKNDYEKKLHELVTEFEQEKFDLQKQHTQNIQEILDDTNDRLQRMEAEYTNQTNITTDVIKELESRVQQLMNEVDSSLNQRSAVEKEKNDVLIKCEKLSNENERLRERLAQQERDQRKIIEAQEHEIKSLKNKTEASLEYLRQEHSMATSKAADTIKDLEEKIEQLKKSLKDSEEHRQRLIREMEQNHQQDKLHLENLHDKQIRNLKKEIEQMDADWHKKVMKLEQLVKDKDQEIHKVKEQKQQQKLQAEQALEDFKSEIERNQNKIYDEMKQQMQQVEIDLQKSKQAREKQSKEFAKQLEDEKYSHQHELAELKMNYEADKSQFMREFHMQKEFLLSEHERDLENLKELHRTEVLSLEARMKEKQDKAEKSAIDNERCIRELREDLLQANQLRKQQLVELGLLREEEKQKMHRDHEAEIARVRGEMEQQRLALQRTHSTDMENVLEKTNQRLIALEKDFTERANKSSETITELQAVIKQLRDDLQRCKENYENKMTDLKRNHEDEKRSLKKKFSHSIEGVKNELEVQRSRGNNAERRLQKAESDLEERLTELKIHYEEKLRGLVPLDVKKELEDTIAALKSQVNSLHLRSTLLQEELDSRNGLSSFGTLTSSVIKSAV